MNEPIYLSEIEILKKFSVMEKHFQRCTGKRYFPSLNFYLNYYDDPITSLKEEAEKMLAFVGLGAYTVKLKVEHLNNAAGLIELTADMYAEITLDIDIYKDIHKSMATLSHEICHKVLFAHGIYFQDPIEIENEIYADLATFYVGFGAFTMKGYSFFNKIRTDTNISIQEERYGYLTPGTYGMAYHLMNVINGIIDDMDYKELPDHAKKEIEKAKKRAFLSSNISYKDLSRHFLTASKDLAKAKLLLENALLLLDENDKVLQQRFKELSNGFYGHSDEKDFEWHKIAIAYKYVLNTNEEGKEHEELSALNDGLSLAIDILTEKGLVLKSKESEFNSTRRCPVCGEKISRKLDSKTFHFICPKCKSHFVIDNNNGEVLISISQSRNKRYNESTELIRLRGEVNELSEEMEEIKSKWWYKLFKKI